MDNTALDKFASDIEKILEEYGDDIQNHLEEVTREVGKKAAQAVKNSAKQTVGGKKYASGWTSKFETSRLGATATVYNSKLPGLAHLLEHGHVIRNGTGRTFGTAKAYKHILPVEEEIAEEYAKEIGKAL